MASLTEMIATAESPKKKGRKQDSRLDEFAALNTAIVNGDPVTPEQEQRHSDLFEEITASTGADTLDVFDEKSLRKPLSNKPSFTQMLAEVGVNSFALPEAQPTETPDTAGKQPFQDALIGPEFLRSAISGVGSAGISFMSMLNRLPTNPMGGSLAPPGESDKLNRAQNRIAQIQSEIDKDDKIPDVVQSGVRSALDSITKMVTFAPIGVVAGVAGSIPVIAGFGLDVANTAFTKGKDAGLGKKDLAKFVATQSAIEVGITTIGMGVGKFLPGAGGLEELATLKTSKAAVKAGFAAALARMGIRTTAELGEETTIEVLSRLNQATALGDEIQPGELKDIVINTVVSTLITMSLAESGHASLSRVIKPKLAKAKSDSRRDTAAALGVKPNELPEILNTKEKRAAEQAKVKGAPDVILESTFDSTSGQEVDLTEEQVNEIFGPPPKPVKEESAQVEVNPVQQPITPVETEPNPVEEKPKETVEASPTPKPEVTPPPNPPTKEQKPTPTPPEIEPPPPGQTFTGTTAETKTEISDAVDSDPTEPKPKGFSSRQAEIRAERAADLGLEDPVSPEKITWAESNATAKEKDLARGALQLAEEINELPRPLNDVETAGLNQRRVELITDYRKSKEEFAKLTDDGEITIKATELNRIEAEYDTITRAQIMAGTEQGRALASRKATIDENLDILSVITRVKAKKGKALTPKEREKFETVVKKLEEVTKSLEAAEKVLAEQKANSHIDSAVKSTRVSKMSTAQKNKQRDDLSAKLIDMIKNGCNF